MAIILSIYAVGVLVMFVLSVSYQQYAIKNKLDPIGGYSMGGVFGVSLIWPIYILWVGFDYLIIFLVKQWESKSK